MAKFVDNYSDLKELGIDCDEGNNSLTEVFNKAANHLQTLLPSVDNQVLLSLYGYYKQGSEGVCNIPKPSWYDMRAKSKWEAWNKLGNMSQLEAMHLYIETIKNLDPSFSESANGSLSNGQWVKVSSMQDEEIIPESDKTLVDFIREGKIDEVKNHIKINLPNKDVINRTDKDGMAPIHWASDSGFSEIIQILINYGADINLQDSDGQTALHYASSCGHIECLKFLLNHGSKADIVDNEGGTPLSVASDSHVKELLTQYIL